MNKSDSLVGSVTSGVLTLLSVCRRGSFDPALSSDQIASYSQPLPFLGSAGNSAPLHADFHGCLLDKYRNQGATEK